MKPFLALTSKDFLTGLSAGAHLGAGGIFFKGAGVTPLFEAGAAQSVNNGLLMAGAAATQVLGNLNGTIISSAQYSSTSNTTVYFGTSTGHIFSLVLDTAFLTSLTDARTVSALRQGLEIFTQGSGQNMLFYFRDQNIGRFDLNATYTDAWATLSADDIHASHSAFGKIWFGNSSYVGKIFDNAGDMSSSGSDNLDKLAFNIGRYGICTDISDDGLNLVIATTKNVACDPNAEAGCTILFWDTYSPLPLREYRIPDPFIFALEHTPKGVFAHGVTGIWQVAFGSEPQQVFFRSPGIYSLNTSAALQYGRPAVSHYGNALLWGGASGSNKVINSLGKLDGDAPYAHLQPFLSTASKNITLVDGQLMKGYVFVADDTPLLKAYPFSTANSPATGITPQTVYFPLPSPVDITAIRVTFGEPLASGDSLGVSLYADQDTTPTSFGTIAYSASKTIRSKTLRQKLSAEDSFSLALSYDGGGPKIKKIEFFGDPRERKND